MTIIIWRVARRQCTYYVSLHTTAAMRSQSRHDTANYFSRGGNFSRNTRLTELALSLFPPFSNLLTPANSRFKFCGKSDSSVASPSLPIISLRSPADGGKRQTRPSNDLSAEKRNFFFSMISDHALAAAGFNMLR